MGQYYLGYVKHNKGKEKVFDNHIGKDCNGLKLMEHSYWKNLYVGQVVNDLFYNKGRVCWVGDYYNENDYEQVNCEDKELVKAIGQRVWDDIFPYNRIKGTIRTARFLHDCLLVNHTKKVYIDCNLYYKQNKWFETWEGKEYPWCVHPLPLLTCTANHSGGSYYGINQNLCGTWFNDEIEVVLDWEEENLVKKGYQQFQPRFTEKQ